MKKIVLAFTMLLATVGMAFAQADLQPIVTVKLGKSETITLKQLKSRVGLFERQANKKLSAEERKSVLEAFVDEKLILHKDAFQRLIHENYIDRENVSPVGGSFPWLVSIKSHPALPCVG